MVKAQLIFTLATVAVANAFSPNSSPQTVSFYYYMKKIAVVSHLRVFNFLHIPETVSGYGD